MKNIMLCGRYRPWATMVYIENALHQIQGVECTYAGSGWGKRPGYKGDVDIRQLIAEGVPRPDLVLLIDPGGEYFPRGLESLDCPTALYLVDVHIDLQRSLEYAQFFDYIFVAQKDYLGSFSIKNSNTYWLPLACDPEFHQSISTGKRYDIGFIGQVHSPERKSRLEQLSKRYVMNDYHQFYPKEKIGPLFAESKIVFNNSLDFDVNMRVFEALASGSMLLTNRLTNGFSDLFESGKHLVAFDSDDEMMALAEYYLTHDQERERIAHAGQQLVLDQHTYRKRCETIIHTVYSKNTARCAPIRTMSRKDTLAAYTKVYLRHRMIDPLLSLLEESRGCGVQRLPTLLDCGEVFLRRLYRSF